MRVEFAFCESVHAGPGMPWHLRKLTNKGRKLSGGIDTSSLCGRVKVPYGWDLGVEINERHLSANTCRECKIEYNKEA